MKQLIILVNILIIIFGIATFAGATLIDRGNGLIYDTDLNITWLQDANYAKTSGYDNDGLMTWYDTMNFAAGLVYEGYDDWRLPSALNQDNSGPCQGYNCTGSEMGHLFYTELGHVAGGGYAGNLGLFTNEPFGNPSLSYGFWTSTRDNSILTAAWMFDLSNGIQDFWSIQNSSYALFVRDGDVASVPEPATVLLLGSGLAGLVALRRKLSA